MVNFNELGLPGVAKQELDPTKIFGELPAGNHKISNLWAGQERALERWHAVRKENDVVVELNTGAGKSLVGLLIAESSVREGRGRVLYLCPTIDLVEQVSREADGLGIKYSTRTSGNWSNDLYKSEKAFCITTYDALFTGRSIFLKDLAPTTLIFDDAHVAESKIREKFTVKVDRMVDDGKNPQFSKLVELILASAPDPSWRSRFETVLIHEVQSDPYMVPTDFGVKNKNQLNEMFANALKDDKDPNYFNIEYLYGKWDRCVVVFTADSIEITPPIPPTLNLPVFASRDVRRIYLSATLTQASDFARAFGRKVRERIRPDVDAGDGERLVLMVPKAAPTADLEAGLVRKAIRGRKALFAVPSSLAAARWKDSVTPVSRKDFTAKLNEFRQADQGNFIIVSRFDGIDLPHDQCRLMVIDKVPAGGSVFERYLFDRLGLRAERAAKIAGRVTQLFGRINRGRRDYGIYLICSEELKDWLSSHRHLALLPELLQKQILLGAFMQERAEVNTSEALLAVIEQVLKRDEGWTKYYGEFLKAQQIDRSEAEFAVRREELLTNLFLEEAAWFSRVWAGDANAQTPALEDAVAAMSAYDTKAAGLADIWIGTVRALAGDHELASAHFVSAQGRLLVELPFERTNPTSIAPEELERLDAFSRKQASVLTGSVNAVNHRLKNVALATLPLTKWDDYSFRQLEEAVRALGEALGFDASRPDSEVGTGPDVVWSDAVEKLVLGIELKTEKEADNISKDEIGQCHNHEEWVVGHYSGFEYLGLVVVTDATQVSGKATPSKTMVRCSSGRVADLRARLLDTLEALKRPISRGDVDVIRKMSSDGAWSLVTLAELLREAPLSTIFVQEE